MSMTQCKLILAHLMSAGSITPKEAMERYGIMRLGARIWDLKHAGHDIITETEQAYNRFGKPTRFARYRLVHHE